MSISFNINPFSVLDKAFGFSEKKQKKREDEVAQRNYAWAKEFAQNSMQWKVEDLRKAGINPIYALGAGGYSAPVSSTSGIPDLGSSGQVGMHFDKKIITASANEIQSRANKNNAEAKAITQTVSSASPVKFLGDVKRLAPSQDLTEAMENDFGSWLSWHGRNTLAPIFNKDEYYNNVWNEEVQKGNANPFKDALIMDNFGNYQIVPKKSTAYKKWDKEQRGKASFWRDTKEFVKNLFGI